MRLIRLREVMEMTGLARATVYKHMKQGVFPESVSLGDRAVAWLESEIQDWILEKVGQRDASSQRLAVSPE